MQPSSQERRMPINPASTTVPIEAATEGVLANKPHPERTEVVIVRVFKINEQITERMDAFAE